MPKLTDTQLVVLSAAADRDNGTALPLPTSLKLKGAAVTKTLEGLCKKGLLEEKPAARDAEAWRESTDGQCMMLVIADAGLRAIRAKSAGQQSKKTDPANAQADKPRAKRSTRDSKPKGTNAAPTVRQGTKQALLIDLLKRKSGATIDDVVKATGWQPHSVRGAISGTIKKKLGLIVSSEKVDGRGRVYRIAARS